MESANTHKLYGDADESGAMPSGPCHRADSQQGALEVCLHCQHLPWSLLYAVWGQGPIEHCLCYTNRVANGQ